MAQGNQDIVDIEILFTHLYLPLFQFPSVIVLQKLIERIEARADRPVAADQVNISVYRTAQFPGFGFGNLIFLTFPEGQQQGFDAVFLFYIEYIIVREKWIKTDRAVFRIGVVYSVLPFGFAVDKTAQALIAVTRIDQNHMGALFVVLSY